MRGLEGLARFLLRSEALASSRIEGLQVSARQLALAELAQNDDSVTRGFTKNAELVANNITTLRQATTALADAPIVDVVGIEALHSALLPDEQHQGLVLLTRSREYVEGLDSYRYIGDSATAAACTGVAEWLAVFLSAVSAATTQV